MFPWQLSRYYSMAENTETRMYSSKMRTARLLTVSCSVWFRGVCSTPFWMQTPGMQTLPLGCTSPPSMQTQLDAEPPGGKPLWMQIPSRCRPLDADPPGHVTCDASWEANYPLVNRITDRCKNITYPKLRLRAVNTKEWRISLQWLLGKFMWDEI